MSEVKARKSKVVCVCIHTYALLPMYTRTQGLYPSFWVTGVYIGVWEPRGEAIRVGLEG